LDWFWQEIRNNKSREEILSTIANMEYDDMISCYNIIKRKQCVSYLKNEVLNVINKKVILLFQIVHKDSKMVEAGILCTEASAMTLRKDIRAGRDACIRLKEVYRCI